MAETRKNILRVIAAALFFGGSIYLVGPAVIAGIGATAAPSDIDGPRCPPRC